MARLSDEEDASSSSEPDTGSDSSSVHTIWDHPPQRARVIAEEANGYSAEYFIRGGGSHFSGKLVDNRAKRKLRSDANDSNRAAKTLRLDSYDIPLTVADLGGVTRQDSDDSDYEDDVEDQGEEEDEEEDEGSDVELNLVTSDVPQARPAVQQRPVQRHHVQQPPTVPGEMTAFTLMRQQLPSLHLQKHDIQAKVRFVADFPVKRVPILTGTFRDNKKQNIVSYLIQATGHLLPDKDACETCRTTRAIYQGCVVSKDPIINESFQGACACCWYGRRAYQCSLRQDYESVSQSNTPVPVPQIPPPPPPPQPKQTRPLSPSVSQFQQRLRPSSAFEFQQKFTPALTSHADPRPTPVPIPQIQQRPTPVPVPQVQLKSTQVPVPQAHQTWKPASGAQLQETPKPAPVSKVQETWKPATISPVPIPVLPTTRRLNSGENQKPTATPTVGSRVSSNSNGAVRNETPTPAQDGSGAGNANGNGNSAVRMETPVFPPKYPPIKAPVPGSVFIPSSHSDFRPQATGRSEDPAQRAPGVMNDAPTASGSGKSDIKNSDQYTGLSVGLPTFSTQMQLSKRDPKEASVKNRVDGWMKRYERMSLHELQATQKHLAEWNTECSVRMEAMMAVLVKKCTTPQAAASDGT